MWERSIGGVAAHADRYGAPRRAAATRISHAYPGKAAQHVPDPTVLTPARRAWALRPSPSPRNVCAHTDTTDMPEPSIRIPTGSDVERIKQIAVEAGMFSPEEAGFIDDMLAGFFDGSLAGHRWVVVDDTSGRASRSPLRLEPFADRVWNLYFIAVAPDKQGHGLGCSLIHHIERS